MLKKTAYQLHGYKIVEDGHSILQWENYTDFGVQQSGRCFIAGDILVLGAPENEEIGCLIGEYNEELAKLPWWSKTTYYCLEEAIVGVPAEKARLGRGLKAPADIEPGRYRLGVYLIETSPGPIIHWSAYAGNGLVTGGKGKILDGILFLTEKKLEKSKGRKAFQKELKLLPDWPNPQAYAPYGAARPCAKDGSSIEATSRSTAVSQGPALVEAIQGPGHSAKRTDLPCPGDDKPDQRNLGLEQAYGFVRGPAQRFVSSWTSRGRNTLVNRLSLTRGKKEKGTEKETRRSRGIWQAGWAGLLLVILILGSFSVIFLHHELDSLAHIFHPGHHSRGSHSRGHSDH